MKKFKTVISLVVAVAMLLFVPGISGLQVSAEEVPAAEAPKPTTYVLRYVGNCWHYQISETGAWQKDGEHREVYYMEQSIKDGDLLVIEDSPNELNLKLPVSLSNITFNHSHCAIITVNSVENVYVLRDSIGVVNGDVNNAYVYDNGIASFNNNVNNLYLMEADTNKQSVGVLGTVGYVEVSVPAWNWIKEQYYSVRKGKFSVQEGVVKTKPEDYSLTPPVVPPAAAVPVA